MITEIIAEGNEVKYLQEYPVKAEEGRYTLNFEAKVVHLTRRAWNVTDAAVRQEQACLTLGLLPWQMELRNTDVDLDDLKSMQDSMAWAINPLKNSAALLVYRPHLVERVRTLRIQQRQKEEELHEPQVLERG